MKNELLALVEAEILDWPGVAVEQGRFNSTTFRYGRREIGHLHVDGVADLPFPRAVSDTLIAEGRAETHRPGFPGWVSYYIRVPDDVPGAVELFRANYDRAKASAELRTASSA